MNRLLFFLLFTSLNVSAGLDFGGYLRGTTGVNSLGTENVCFKNKNVPPTSNDFRLANECALYAELKFKSSVMKVDNKIPKLQLKGFFAYSHDNRKSYEDMDGHFLPEFYAEFSDLIDSSGATVWAGKRLYRYVIAGMLDFFYMADMEGSGFGIENIDAGFGKLNVAWMRESSEASIKQGNITKHAVDIRLKEISLFENLSLDYWIAAGFMKGGSNSTGDNYRSNNGLASGLLFRVKKNQYKNDLAFVWGNKNMQSMTLDSTLQKEGLDEISSSWRWRVFNSTSMTITDNFDIEMALGYEKWKTGPDVVVTHERYLVGARPTYYFNDKFSLLGEVGTSSVRLSSESEDRKLTRITLGPQIHIKKRSSTNLRFMISQNFLSSSNKDLLSNSVGERTKVTNFVTQLETSF